MANLQHLFSRKWLHAHPVFTASVTTEQNPDQNSNTKLISTKGRREKKEVASMVHINKEATIEGCRVQGLINQIHFSACNKLGFIEILREIHITTPRQNEYTFLYKSHRYKFWKLFQEVPQKWAQIGLHFFTITRTPREHSSTNIHQPTN